MPERMRAIRIHRMHYDGSRIFMPSTLHKTLDPVVRGSRIRKEAHP